MLLVRTFFGKCVNWTQLAGNSVLSQQTRKSRPKLTTVTEKNNGDSKNDHSSLRTRSNRYNHKRGSRWTRPSEVGKYRKNAGLVWNQRSARL